MTDQIQELASEYYDFYKDVYNVRPRWIYSTNDEGEVAINYTEEQLLTMLEELAGQAKIIRQAEAEQEQQAIAEFEARVLLTIQSGARDRETAIRWIFDAEEDPQLEYDPDYFCYKYSLPYGYFKVAA